MFENKLEAVSTCMRNTAGTHVLFRAFGCNSVDATPLNLGAAVSVQIATFYPDVNRAQVERIKADRRGGQLLNISLGGAYGAN